MRSKNDVNDNNMDVAAGEVCMKHVELLYISPL